MFKFFNKSVETVLFDASNPEHEFSWPKNDVFGILKGSDLVRKEIPDKASDFIVNNLIIKDGRKGVVIELEVIMGNSTEEKKKIELTAKEFHNKFPDIECKDATVNKKLHGTGRGIA